MLLVGWYIPIRHPDSVPHSATKAFKTLPRMWMSCTETPTISCACHSKVIRLAPSAAFERQWTRTLAALFLLEPMSWISVKLHREALKTLYQKYTESREYMRTQLNDIACDDLLIPTYRSSQHTIVEAPNTLLPGIPSYSDLDPHLVLVRATSSQAPYSVRPRVDSSSFAISGGRGWTGTSEFIVEYSRKGISRTVADASQDCAPGSSSE